MTGGVMPTWSSGKGACLENRLCESACGFESYRWRLKFKTKTDVHLIVFCRFGNYLEFLLMRMQIGKQRTVSRQADD